jgi:uncharacterized protein
VDAVWKRTSRAAASEAYSWSERFTYSSEKSTPPVIIPIGGMSTSVTKEFTTEVNAAPMTMPTARSMTLPRAMNFLNGEGRGRRSRFARHPAAPYDAADPIARRAAAASPYPTSQVTPPPPQLQPREPIRAKESSWTVIVAFVMVSSALLVLGVLAPRRGPLMDLLSGPIWLENLVLFAALLVVAVGGVLFGAGRLRPREVGLDRRKLREGVVAIAILYAAIQLVPAVIELVLTGGVELNRAWTTRGVQQVLVWAAVMFLTTALYEEIAFRGFLFPQLYLKTRGTHRARFWTALLASQIVFGLIHFPGHVFIRNMSGPSLWGMMAAQAFVGVLLLLLYLRTRNLWIAIGVHGLVNAPTPLVSNPIPWEIYLVVLLVAWPWLARRPEHRGLARIEEIGPRSTA